ADVLALALLFGNHFAAAEAVVDESLWVNAIGATALLVWAASYTARDMSGEARLAADQVIINDPGFSVRRFAEQQPYKLRSDLETFTARRLDAVLPA
ncbi:MAG: hypothetical protein VCB77_06340, partial [Alphaproteobacteria bacterium]